MNWAQRVNMYRILKFFSSFSVQFLLDLESETLLQIGQPYALYDVVLTDSQSGHAPGGVVPILMDYDKH